MLDAIVFDFDGVLVDSEPLHYQAFVLIARSLGLELTFEQYVTTYIGFDDRDAFRVMLEVTQQDASEERVAALCERKRPTFEALARAADGSATGLALPGSVELLDAAKASGLRVAIASGASRADIELMLGLLDRSEAFEQIVTADDVERSKPNPASYALAVEGLGLEPGRCLAIEDTRAGLRSARDAGLRTLAVTTSHEAAELSGDAERVVETLLGVSPKRLAEWYG